MKPEPTNTEVLEAIQEFSTTTEKRFDGMDQRFDGVEKSINTLAVKVINIENRLDTIEERLTRLEATAQQVYSKIDEFIGLIKTQELELTALRSHVYRLEERLARVEMTRGITSS